MSVLARAHGIPFYVAAPDLHHRPVDTDRAPTSRSSIGPRTRYWGRTPRPMSGVYNAAFDVTPAENISAIVTEDGVLRPPFQLVG